jgi:hypothetical protein
MDVSLRGVIVHFCNSAMWRSMSRRGNSPGWFEAPASDDFTDRFTKPGNPMTWLDVMLRCRRLLPPVSPFAANWSRALAGQAHGGDQVDDVAQAPDIPACEALDAA